MNSSKLRYFLLPLLITFWASQASGQNYFLARVIPEQGTSEFRSVSGDWQPLDRTRYLVNTNAIRTQAGATVLVEVPGVSASSRLVENSEFELVNNEIQLVRGEFVNARITANNLVAKLQGKLEDAFNYLTSRRQAPCQPVVRTARNLTLSPSYPDLVWQNACPSYTYRLTIDGEIYETPQVGDEDFVRFTVADMSPGPHEYRVEILDNGRLIYTPSADSTFIWIADGPQDELESEIALLERDVIAQIDLLEDNGFLVPVMDKYRDYFEVYSEQNYLRPLLIKAYAQLGLYNLQSEEVRLYNSLRNI